MNLKVVTDNESCKNGENSTKTVFSVVHILTVETDRVESKLVYREPLLPSLSQL